MASLMGTRGRRESKYEQGVLMQVCRSPTFQSQVPTSSFPGTPLVKYILGLALKLHFSSDYDYFKYNGKTNATQQSFEKRKDRFRFSKLARKLEDPLLIEFFVSNIIF